MCFSLPSDHLDMLRKKKQGIVSLSSWQLLQNQFKSHFMKRPAFLLSNVHTGEKALTPTHFLGYIPVKKKQKRGINGGRVGRQQREKATALDLVCESLPVVSSFIPQQNYFSEDKRCCYSSLYCRLDQKVSFERILRLCRPSGLQRCFGKVLYMFAQKPLENRAQTRD